MRNFLAVFLLFLGSSLQGAAIWVESGEAGSLPNSAQYTFGLGSLDGIDGSLTELSSIDMYWIRITMPQMFSATTLDFPGLVPDPQLFLFDRFGVGVYTNDDGIGSQSQLPAGNLLGPQTTGLYLLAIGRFDNDPFSAAGLIFQGGSGVNGPDLSAGGASSVVGWNNNVTGRDDFASAYAIDLTGAEFATAIPEPGSWILGLAGLGSLLVWKRTWKNEPRSGGSL